MSKNTGPSGEMLLVIATVVSLQIAQNKTLEQLELLSAFLTVLGENLELIATRMPNDAENISA